MLVQKTLGIILVKASMTQILKDKEWYSTIVDRDLDLL